MDSAGIGGPRDDAVTGIDLANEVTLAEPADTRIARHGPDIGGVERRQSDRRTAPRGRRSGLDAGMATADHDNVEGVHGRAISRLFHVEHSLSDAEPREQRIEHGLDSGIPGDPRQCDIGPAQGVGDHQLVMGIQVVQRIQRLAAMQ